MADALASRADEGRGKRRYATAMRMQQLNRRCPNVTSCRGPINHGVRELRDAWWLGYLLSNESLDARCDVAAIVSFL